MKIAVIYGGISSEREVSIRTGKEIVNNLDRNKYEIFELEIFKKEDILELKDKNIDFVYIALHGIFGENGEVQAILNTLNIPYSGSDVLSSAMSMDKNISKILLKNANVNIIDGICLTKEDNIKFSDLNLGNKVILKPNSGGSSIGIYFASNEIEFENAKKEIFKLDDEIIVEKIISGLEISVPVIGGKVFPTLKIKPLKDDFFDYNSKYQDGGALETVHIFEKELQEKIDLYALRAYKALKCKGFARIDFIILENEVYCLEVNSLPGMTKNSLLPKSTLYKGYSYSETLDLLIKESLNEKNK